MTKNSRMMINVMEQAKRNSAMVITKPMPSVSCFSGSSDSISAANLELSQTVSKSTPLNPWNSTVNVLYFQKVQECLHFYISNPSCCVELPICVGCCLLDTFNKSTSGVHRKSLCSQDSGSTSLE